MPSHRRISSQAFSFVALLLWLYAVGAQSRPTREAPDPETEETRRPRTCLVLGGGGARGAAHIGVLKVLERERIPVDCIVGTSMGAIVGGLYASGYTADEIDTVLDGIDWDQVLHDNPPRQERSMRRKEDDLRLLGGLEVGVRDGKIAFPRGIIQGQRLELLLRQLLLATWQIKDFDALPIPFRAIATDIVTGDKVVFADGDLVTAVRASMSVPGVFAPVRVGDHLLVDGGVVDNLPIDEARRLGAERLIVSRVGTPPMDEEQLDSPLAISQQMANLLMTRIVDAQIATLGAQDVLIVPQLGDIASQDFDRATDTVPLGEAAAEQALLQLRQLSVSGRDYAHFTQRHRPPDYTAPIIAFVDVLRGDTRTATYVDQRVQDYRGKRLDPERLDAQLASAYGEGRYEQMQWRLVERDNATGLQILPRDKRWGPGFLHFGLRISDDFEGANTYQLISEYTHTGLSEEGAEARLRASLGNVEQLFGEYYSPFGNQAQHAWSAYGNYRATDQDLSTGQSLVGQYRYSQWFGGLRWLYSPRTDWEASLSLERGREWLALRVGDSSQLGNYDAELGSLALQLRHDSIDSSAFPGSGQRLSLTYQTYFAWLGSDATAQATRLQWDAAWSQRDNHWLAGLRANSSSGDGDQLFATYGFLGGLGNLSGYPEQSIFAPQTALARLVYYRRLPHADSLLSLPIYVGGSVEWGGAWERRSDVGTDGLVGAASIFVGADTLLGPIYLGYGRAETGASAFYLTFGSLLRTLDGF